MAPARRWNLADFDLVLNHPTLSVPELALRLPRRRPREIEALRASIHATHGPYEPDATVGLRMNYTDAMSRHVSKRRGTLTCALCGARF